MTLIRDCCGTLPGAQHAPDCRLDIENDVTITNVLNLLRSANWSVAVHNDYFVNDKPATFWLFTHPSGLWVKGEGWTDGEALAQAAKQAADRLRAIAGKWQDIGMAPFNKRVLIQAKNATTDEIAVGWHDEISQRWYYAPQGGFVLWQPTHWMELPEGTP